MIFKKNLNCFFSKFQFQNWNFQNWNLGNMWTQNTQTHPPTSPTQHTNTPTDPPKIKTLITHKHTTHKHTTHNTQHKHCCGCTTGPKKKYILLWVQACERVRCKEHRTAKFKKTKTGKKKVKVSQSDSHTFTVPHKKKRCWVSYFHL